MCCSEALRLKQPGSHLQLDAISCCCEIVSFLHDFGETFGRKCKEVITKLLNVMENFQSIQVFERRFSAVNGTYMFF